jgi:adenylosuccinate lyase
MKLRGIKGPVGTQQDQAELLGSPEAAARLDARLATALGFAGVMGSVGQVYPRSLDLEVVAALVQLVSGPVNLTNTLRLMAGHELASEGFSPDQVGSSAMPHKMNARTSERVHGLKVVLGGYLAMALGLAGEQWNEGDVSCSVVRRVMIPDSFLAADGLFQSFLTILDELSFFPAAIEREVAAHLPFLSTTRLLTAAVAAGMGREEAHDLIRRHAVEAARERQRGGDGDLVARLVADQSFPLDSDAIRDLLQVSPPGRVAHQIAEFTATVAGLVERYPAAATYRPAPIV